MSDLLKKRDPARVYAALKQAGSRKVATEPVKMIFPTRWLERELAVIENIITVLGYVAIVTEDGSYAVSNVSGFLRTEPDRITKTVIDNESYTVFWFNKGSNVIASTDIVMIDSLVHTIYTELLGRGRTPFYYDYGDMPRLFDNIPYYNGVDGKGDPVIWSYMAATATRDPDDLQKPYRQRNDRNKPPVLVGLKRVSFHGNSLLAKQGGSYYDSGTTSALANPSSKVDSIENILTQQ